MSFGSYTCEHCGETFDETRSEEEARAEAAEIFSSLELSMPQAIICDECWEQFMEWFRAHPEIRIQ